MVTNFEDITEDLTEDEKNVFLPALVSGFKTHGKDDPVKEPKIVSGVNDYLSKRGYNLKLSGAKLRKLVNYIRVKGILPLIATNQGYYVSYDKEEIQKQIQSLQDRSNAIVGAANGLQVWLNR